MGSGVGSKIDPKRSKKVTKNLDYFQKIFNSNLIFFIVGTPFLAKKTPQITKSINYSGSGSRSQN